MNKVDIVQMMPELAEREAIRAPPLAVKQHGGYINACSETNLAIEPQLLCLPSEDCIRPDRSIRVFFYVGSPSDNIGQNGDFYLEEEANVLYGPKSMGVWPENGVDVAGPIVRKCKRDPQPSWSIDLNEFKRCFKERRASERRDMFRRAAFSAFSWLVSTRLSSARSFLASSVNKIFRMRSAFEEAASSKKTR